MSSMYCSSNGLYVILDVITNVKMIAGTKKTQIRLGNRLIQQLKEKQKNTFEQ